MGTDFVDPQKRPQKAPQQPIQKPLQSDDIWPEPEKKAGHGAGVYGRTVPGGLKDYDPYGLDKQVYGDNGPPSLDKLDKPQAAVPRPVVYLKDFDPYGLDKQVYGDNPPRIAIRQAAVPKPAAPKPAVRLKDYDPYGLDKQVYGDNGPPSLDQPQAVVEQKPVPETKAKGVDDSQTIQSPEPPSPPQLSPLTPPQPAPIQVASATLTPGMLKQPQLGNSSEPLLPSASTATGTAPLSAVAAPVLMAQTIPFPSGGLSLPPLPNPFPLLKPLTPFVKGVGGVFGGFVLEGVFAAPANHEEVEWLRQRDQQHNTPAPAGSTPASEPVQPSAPTAPMSVEPSYQVPNALEQQQDQKRWEQEQQKQEDEFKAQQAAFKSQQKAQKELWAKQEKLNRLSAGFMLNEEPVKTFEAQLTPSQKGALTKQVNERYRALMGLAQQADNPFEPYEVAEIQQKIRQQVLYERFIPVREIYHFGNQFLNEYTPQKMKAVRGYFDQVFEGKYAKSIPADKQTEILRSADAKYTEETGKKPNRDDILWKTYRNVEATEKFPDLWTQFRDDLSKAENGVMPTVVGSKDPNLGSNALNRPNRTQPLNIPDHTGHRPEQVDTTSKGFDLDSAPKVPNDTAHRDKEKPDVTNVFAAKEGEIPGVDIPFRKVNPKYPANPDVLGEIRVLQDRIRIQRNDKYDCSEIAEDLLKIAKGKGKIIEVIPPKGKKLTLYELGEKEDFIYHQVYSDGQYVYDPRASSDPIPKGDWEIMVRSLNPGAVFK